MLTVDFTPFPTLETERLLLRQCLPEDVDDLYYLRSSEEVMKYIDRPRPRSKDDILALIQLISDRIASNEGINWALVTKDEEKFIGLLGFHRIEKENYRAEIGYMMHPAYHGKGLANEAVQATVNYAFTRMGVHSIQANVNPDNTPSRRLLERNGFVQEAHFKENHFWNGKFYDTVIYSRLANN